MFKVTKVKSKIRTISIQCYGVSIDIPSNADIRYITVNGTGVVCGWDLKPVYNEAMQIWVVGPGVNASIRYLGVVEFVGDCKESLFEISDNYG